MSPLSEQTLGCPDNLNINEHIVFLPTVITEHCICALYNVHTLHYTIRLHSLDSLCRPRNSINAYSIYPLHI